MQEAGAEKVFILPRDFSLSLRERVGVRVLGRAFAGAGKAAGRTLTLPSPLGATGFTEVEHPLRG
jgi:hypothetical protein